METLDDTPGDSKGVVTKRQSQQGTEAGVKDSVEKHVKLQVIIANEEKHGGPPGDVLDQAYHRKDGDPSQAMERSEGPLLDATSGDKHLVHEDDRGVVVKAHIGGLADGERYF